MKADLVITNGKVITVDRDFSIKQAVAVKDGKIVAVGGNDEIKPFIASDFGGNHPLSLSGDFAWETPRPQIILIEEICEAYSN